MFDKLLTAAVTFAVLSAAPIPALASEEMAGEALTGSIEDAEAATKIDVTEPRENVGTGANVVEKADPAGERTAAEVLPLVDELASRGRAEDDVYLLIAAARLAQGLDFKEIVAKDIKVAAESVATEKTAKTHPWTALTADVLLDEAADLAQDDADATAAIAQIRTVAADAVDGAHCHTKIRINARSYRDFIETFYGDRRATVVGRGDGDTDVDLLIFDENGNRICADTRGTDQIGCSWTPRWTGPFRIRLLNLGGVYNTVRFCVN